MGGATARARSRSTCMSNPRCGPPGSGLITSIGTTTPALSGRHGSDPPGTAVQDTGPDSRRAGTPLARDAGPRPSYDYLVTVRSTACATSTPPDFTRRKPCLKPAGAALAAVAVTVTVAEAPGASETDDALSE